MSDVDTLQRPRSGHSSTAESPPGLLRFYPPPTAHRLFRLRPGMQTLGRDDGADVHVEDLAMSRRHAVLEVGSAGVTIGDAGSANGVFVNGARIRTQRLVDGDIVRAGDTLLKFWTRSPRGPDVIPIVRDGMAGGVSLVEVRRLLSRAATSDLTVLILGDTGTGKELASRIPHDEGPRADGPFIPINCGALPSQLVEAELFGATRGAFTGADVDRAGLISAADGGTLFLDEIGELPLPAQAKLLRFLEDKSARAIGSNEARRFDVRVIAATNTNLEAAAHEGRFRLDLYARLARIVVALPPLSARREDVPLLIDRFLGDLGETQRQIDPDTMEKLCLRPWPCNIRELRAAVDRAIFAADDDTSLRFEEPTPRPDDGPDRPAPIEHHPDAQALTDALRESNGDVEEVGERLRLSRSQVYRRAKQHGIVIASFRRPAPK